MRTSTVNFKGAIEVIHNGIKNGIENEFIPHIMPIIKERTPELTGALRQSEKAEVSRRGNKTKLEISANTPYAAIQHEMPNYMHTTGESGYILNPIAENIDEFMRIMTESIGESLRNGGNES